MDEASPYQLIKTLETQVGTLLSHVDVEAVSLKERQLVALIKRQLNDARLDVRDYEYADTRAEQTDHGTEARQRLTDVQQTIVAASEYNIFSAVDVALFTAKAQHIATQLI